MKQVTRLLSSWKEVLKQGISINKSWTKWLSTNNFAKTVDFQFGNLQQGVKMRCSAQQLAVLCLICLPSLSYGKFTAEKVSRKHSTDKVRNSTPRRLKSSRSPNLSKKSKETGVTVKGTRKNLLNPLVSSYEGPHFSEAPLPIHIEHIKDYPVAVPVKKETTEHILHVHIHDSEFVFSY